LLEKRNQKNISNKNNDTNDGVPVVNFFISRWLSNEI